MRRCRSSTRSCKPTSSRTSLSRSFSHSMSSLRDGGRENADSNILWFRWGLSLGNRLSRKGSLNFGRSTGSKDSTLGLADKDSCQLNSGTWTSCPHSTCTAATRREHCRRLTSRLIFTGCHLFHSMKCRSQEFHPKLPYWYGVPRITGHPARYQ